MRRGINSLSCEEILVHELKRLPSDRFALEQLRNEIAELDAEFAAIKATDYDKIPGGKGGNVQEEKLLSAIARKTEVRRWLKATSIHVRNMDRLLGTLSDSDRKIVERMVINRAQNAEDELSAEIGIERRQIYNRKADIIRQLCMRQYGQGFKP